MPIKPRARSFLTTFATNHAEYRAAAGEAEELVRRTLVEQGIGDVSVTSRAKGVQSAIEKVRRKGYGVPKRQLTDVVGIRVLTYYRDVVDLAADALRTGLEVDERRSPDKRKTLALREFGYRSVHLLARQRVVALGSALGNKWFEIQIRSLLEHAWAEIEHEVVYKGGVAYPDLIKREFSALAGTLEILDREFLRLRAERSRLIETYRETFAADSGWDDQLDAARLAGLLEHLRPLGLSWRGAEERGAPFPSHSATTLVEALVECGVRTPNEFADVLASPRFRGKLGSFASSRGVSGAEVSHFAIGIIAVWTTDSSVLEEEFPELAAVLPRSASTSTGWITVQLPS